jgi:hypothetical protein
MHTTITARPAPATRLRSFVHGTAHLAASAAAVSLFAVGLPLTSAMAEPDTDVQIEWAELVTEIPTPDSQPHEPDTEVAFPDDDPVEVTDRLARRMSTLLHEVQEGYPDGNPARAWWVPARLGGGAPSHDDVLRAHEDRTRSWDQEAGHDDAPG